MSKKVEVRVGTLEDMGRRFIDAWHRAESGDAVNEICVTFHDLPALPTALTPKRICGVTTRTSTRMSRP